MDKFISNLLGWWYSNFWFSESGKTKKTGTKVTFKPDSSIFKATTAFNFDILSERLQESAFLLKT